MFVVICIIVANLAVTYQGLKDWSYLDKYRFQVDAVLVHKEWIRLLSSAFLHVDWMHFGFNMLTLYFFGEAVTTTYGVEGFLLIYFGSLFAAKGLVLLIHRQHGSYSAVGASGAVSGVVMSYAVAYPTSEILLFMVLPLPTWLYAGAYVLYSIYGIKKRVGNIGHDAHLGGAAGGTLLAATLMPAIVAHNWYMFLIILLPIGALIWMLNYHPGWLMVDGYARRHLKTVVSSRSRKATDFNSEEEELDYYLDKIRLSGMNSLSAAERKRLDKLSSYF